MSSTVHLVSFANQKFSTAQRWLMHSARQYGINSQINQKHSSFRKTDFYQRHLNICSEPFGAGFYLWKPYYIYEALTQVKEGDIVLYIDSGHVLINDPLPLIELTRKQDIVLFENYQGYHFFSHSGLPFTQEHCYRTVNYVRYWCKADCLQLMGAYNQQAVLNSMMVDASIMLVKKSKASMQFISEWLHHCTDRRCISWDDNVLGLANHAGFIMHIYDQSVISILAAQQGLELYRCPSQYGNHLKPESLRKNFEHFLLPYASPKTNSSYDTITHHHRYKEQGTGWRWKQHLYREAVIFNARILQNRIGFVNRMLKIPVHNIFS